MKKAIRFLAKLLCAFCALVILATGSYLLFITVAGAPYKEIAAIYDQRFASWSGEAYTVYQTGSIPYVHTSSSGDDKIELSSPNTSWIEEGLNQNSDSEQALFAYKFQHLDSRKYISDESKEQALLLGTTMFESELSQEDYDVLKSNLIVLLNRSSINPVWFDITNFIQLNF